MQVCREMSEHYYPRRMVSVQMGNEQCRWNAYEYHWETGTGDKSTQRRYGKA